MTLIFVVLLVATVATSILLGTLGKLPPKELMMHTVAMVLAAIGFFGLVTLVA